MVKCDRCGKDVSPYLFNTVNEFVVCSNCYEKARKELGVDINE